MRAAITDMRSLAVPVMASTDAGIPGVFHQDLAAALAVFQKVAGMSNEETLVAATSDAAAGLGLEDQTGLLAEGLAGDVLVVDGDPVADLAALQHPIGVWARGTSVLAP